MRLEKGYAFMIYGKLREKQFVNLLGQQEPEAYSQWDLGRSVSPVSNPLSAEIGTKAAL